MSQPLTEKPQHLLAEDCKTVFCTTKITIQIGCFRITNVLLPVRVMLINFITPAPQVLFGEFQLLLFHTTVIVLTNYSALFRINKNTYTN
jgi:hypothetical protein